MAFWVNAYNAFVLQTVVNHYPIRGTSSAYPVNSIRQIPGAFDQATGTPPAERVTLDEIEKTILPEFKEPRLYLALGRGAVGSGRLKSEAYTGDASGEQLDEIQQEFVNEADMLQIDRRAGSGVGDADSQLARGGVRRGVRQPAPTFAARSPIERALVAFIRPNLLPLETELVQKNEFKVSFQRVRLAPERPDGRTRE